jgi:tetratricopeptide (TPR) repeat protein
VWAHTNSITKPTEAAQWAAFLFLLCINTTFAKYFLAMEEEKLGYSSEEEAEVLQAVQKFERMKKNNERCFFDVIEFELIIDYYIENNNPSKAFEAADLASEQHPNSTSIQLHKTKALLDKGRAVEALSLLKKLENIEADNCELYILKGTAYCILGDVQGAIKMFDKALVAEPDETEYILFSITSVLQIQNYYRQMIPYMLKLIELEPDFKAHLYDLAFAYDKIDDFENSIKYYLEYLEDDPFSDSAWYNLGIIYNKLDMFEKAMEAYDFALAINSQNTFALFNKANILNHIEKYREAIQVYHEYIENEPDSFEAMTYMAECYENSGDFIMAKKYYQEALDLAPDYADPWFGLGILALDADSVEESILYFRKAVMLDDENPEYWYLLGQAHIKNEEPKIAVRCFREALKLNAYCNEIWADLGKIIFNEDIVKRSVPLLEKAYKIMGDVPGISYLLAALYLHLNIHDKAYKHLLSAVNIGKNVFPEFAELFPASMMTRKMKKLFGSDN